MPNCRTCEKELTNSDYFCSFGCATIGLTRDIEKFQKEFDYPYAEVAEDNCKHLNQQQYENIFMESVSDNNSFVPDLGSRNRRPIVTTQTLIFNPIAMKGFNHLTIHDIAGDEEAYNSYMKKYGGGKSEVKPPSAKNIEEAKRLATIIQNLYELD